ncbi:twin-arginine translocase TatA/TatE family subunit [Streptomyces adustus]|nr:twin-arginine translocase TatA/TatE family subunit [Streptomyces adustus]
MSRERQALMFGMSERVVILFVASVVHGIRKPPELKRSAGTAGRIFKSEVKALKEQDSQGSAAGSDMWSLALGSAGTKDPRAPEGSV